MNKTLKRLITLMLVTATCTTYAATSRTITPTLEEMWKLLQTQQQEISDLRAQLSETQSQADQALDASRTTGEQVNITADFVEQLARNDRSTASTTTVGGYGELHYNNLDADDSSRDLDQVDFHRYVMFLSHEFNDRVRFFSEWELEHSLLKDTKDGSSNGEVELEQAYIEIDLNDQHYTRSGVFLIPVGIMNETHEPPTFYGVERNDVENVIIPATWWEAGLEIGGHYSNGLSWDLALHSGLEMPTTGGSAFRIRSGRQKASKASTDDLAVTFRLGYTGIAGLSLAGTYQHQNDASQVSGDGLDSADLLSLQAVFNRGPFTVKSLWAEWNVDGSAVSAADVDEQSGWYFEPSYRFAMNEHQFGVYTRFEDVDGARTQDRFDQWELGFNYWPVDNVVFKFDYRDRQHDLNSDSGRDFTGIDLGLGYQF